jgi:hypothetical protein
MPLLGAFRARFKGLVRRSKLEERAASFCDHAPPCACQRRRQSVRTASVVGDIAGPGIYASASRVRTSDYSPLTR